MDQQATAPVSIRNFKDAPSADVHIKNPMTGEPMGIVITIAGPEHPQRKATAYAKQRRMRAEMAKTGKLPVTDPREDEQEALDTLATITLKWEAPAGSGMPEFSQSAARTLYADSDLQWLRRQVQAFADEVESFIVRSAPN